MTVEATITSPAARHSENRREWRAGFFAARNALLAERDDLRGVHPFADYLDDAVRWSA